MASLRIIPMKVHGVLDYAVALTLVVAPIGLGFGAGSALALWFSVVAGGGLLVYSLLTDYSMGARALLSFGQHLVLDFLAGTTFLAIGVFAGFESLPRWFYMGMGAAVMLVVLTSQRDESEVRSAAHV